MIFGFWDSNLKSSLSGRNDMTLNIVTIDDSRTMRDMLKLVLTDAGHRVAQAIDGIDGLELLEHEMTDVIITDINMPRLDGFGFIEAARKIDRIRSVPILVLTTESDAEKKMRAKRAGATGWIVKPFEPKKLVDIVHRVAI